MLSTIRMLLQRGPAARSSSMLLQRVRHDVSGMLSIRLQLARAKHNLALQKIKKDMSANAIGINARSLFGNDTDEEECKSSDDDVVKKHVLRNLSDWDRRATSSVLPTKKRRTKRCTQPGLRTLHGLRPLKLRHRE